LFRFAEPSGQADYQAYKSCCGAKKRVAFSSIDSLVFAGTESFGSRRAGRFENPQTGNSDPLASRRLAEVATQRAFIMTIGGKRHLRSLPGSLRRECNGRSYHAAVMTGQADS